jgi:hypothetical protein
VYKQRAIVKAYIEFDPHSAVLADYDIFGAGSLLSHAQVHVRVPLLQRGQQRVVSLLEIVVHNQRVEVSLLVAVLEFAHSILQTDLDLQRVTTELELFNTVSFSQ